MNGSHQNRDQADRRLKISQLFAAGGGMKVPPDTQRYATWDQRRPKHGKAIHIVPHRDGVSCGRCCVGSCYLCEWHGAFIGAGDLDSGVWGSIGGLYGDGVDSVLVGRSISKKQETRQ